ncbi:hypothetical protein NKW53_11895 [Acetobacter orientalis]|uniref:hypothetical protein n=1 Tax=Acetobacter orientalis TaxID=146474 RepID=UPI00209C9C73|nr:hypothetical protein [Acetobacter orientalis]MCP1216767.1 hypothetical protein [Acetobacter orientalis]MCP1219494.1 hypothetical protein [Acetobacter orientalis]
MKSSGYERHADDWYIEPKWCIEALLAHEKQFQGTVLDPCCGSGNIVQTLCQHDINAVGADLRDRANGTYSIMGYAQSLIDVRPTSVISNPPYGVAEDFVESSLHLTKDRVCVLLRLAFLEGQRRKDWFKKLPLARVWVSSKRISMPPGGTDIPAKGGSVAFAWFVFEHGCKDKPVLGWL